MFRRDLVLPPALSLFESALVALLFAADAQTRRIRSKIGLQARTLAEVTPKEKGVSRIWIQAVSVGELSSIGKLLESLLADPEIEIVLSGTTSTGLAIAEEKHGGRLLAHVPFPLDWLPFSRLAWSRIRPELAITVDSELWPEHMHQAKSHGVPFDHCKRPTFRPVLQPPPVLPLLARNPAAPFTAHSRILRETTRPMAEPWA